MPKIIPGLRERLIAAAQERLFAGDSHDITMRQVAQDCHTAVGTVYNYFPSKETLLAAVMMGDWLDCCRDMREDASAAETPLAALRATTAALRRFTSRYGPLWQNYVGARDTLEELNARHRQIIEAIGAAVSETLRRFGVDGAACPPEVLAELILMASREDDGFARVAPVLEKLLS